MEALQLQLGNTADLPTFMFAGRAKFVLISKKTGNHMAFKVSKPISELNDPRVPYFVSVRGNGGAVNMDERHNWNFIGSIFDKKRYAPSKKSPVPVGSVSHKTVEWLLNNIESDQYTWEHVGCCARCGRQLTDPLSIDRGFGPECFSKIV